MNKLKKLTSKIEKKDINKIFMIFVLSIILIGVLIYMILFTNLSLNGELTTELYSYIGNDQVTNCDDDLFYLSEGVTYDSLDASALICNAYLFIESSGEELEVNESSEEGTCEIDALLLSTDYGSDVCTATKYDVDELSDAYYTIYGKTLETYESFSLSNGDICEFNVSDSNYYCYASTDEVAVSFNSTITYRLLKNSVDVYDGTIVIRDYFLNINSSTCYEDITIDNKNYDCTYAVEDFSELQIDTNFMKTYGSIYEHTFTKDVNGDYHWISTTKIS